MQIEKKIPWSRPWGKKDTIIGLIILIITFPLWWSLAIWLLSLAIGTCGKGAILPSAINEKCECNGLSLSTQLTTGGNTSVCLGKCISCQCKQGGKEIECPNKKQ